MYIYVFGTYIYIYMVFVLTAGNDVVLGPPQLVQYGTMANGVAVEQAVSRQRLRPGSGLLSVRVVTDGPTRVLQITDVHSKVQKL